MVTIDPDILRQLITGAVSEAMKPYQDELKMQSNRITALETINARDKNLCPQNCPCQAKLDNHTETLTKAYDSAKSAHRRIDGVFKTAAIVGASVSGVVTLLLIVVQIVLQAHRAGVSP